MTYGRKLFLPVLAAVSMLAGSHAMAQGALDLYRWKSRLLVISAPNAKDDRLIEQIADLAAHGSEIGERDLMIVKVIGDRVEASDGALLPASAVRAATGLAPGRFGVALIGKDGGEKFKRDRPVTAAMLFETIDAMPMRQNEMKRGAKG
jgi:hypothetical protein